VAALYRLDVAPSSWINIKNPEYSQARDRAGSPRRWKSRRAVYVRTHHARQFANERLTGGHEAQSSAGYS
jgi:hypothetical protein